MRPKPNYITSCLDKVDRDYQSEIIPFDIKDNSVIVYYAGIAINLFQLINLPNSSFENSLNHTKSCVSVIGYFLA
jgi:hypothetical protein